MVAPAQRRSEDDAIRSWRDSHTGRACGGRKGLGGTAILGVRAGGLPWGYVVSHEAPVRHQALVMQLRAAIRH